MAAYKVYGFHCESCAKDLEQRLNSSTHFQGTHVDYQNQKIVIPAQVDLHKLKQTLAFEKIVIEPIEPEFHHHGQETHSHDHGHSHGISVRETVADHMKVVFVINILFSLIEFIFGALFNSAGILSDAIHDSGDAVSVGSAWFFQKVATREPNNKYSFGHQRFALLGALITGGVLMSGSLFLIINTIPKLLNPEPVNYTGMFWLALFAIGANGFSAWLMSRGSSANESMLNLHLLEDVLGWIAVLIVSVVVRFTNWYILDPILSLAIAGFIFYNTWPLFKKTIEIFLEAVPADIDFEKIEHEIRQLAHVSGLSHLHIWSIDGEEHAMAVTVSTDTRDTADQETLKEQIRHLVAPHHITHSTIELMVASDLLLK